MDVAIISYHVCSHFAVHREYSRLLVFIKARSLRSLTFSVSSPTHGSWQLSLNRPYVASASLSSLNSEIPSKLEFEIHDVSAGQTESNLWSQTYCILVSLNTAFSPPAHFVRSGRVSANYYFC